MEPWKAIVLQEKKTKNEKFWPRIWKYHRSVQRTYLEGSFIIGVPKDE
jgi:hypothetical protein